MIGKINLRIKTTEVLLIFLLIIGAFIRNINTSRFFSATFSSLFILLVFYLEKTLFSKNVGLSAATFTSLNPVLIQASHFGPKITLNQSYQLQLDLKLPIPFSS